MKPTNTLLIGSPVSGYEARFLRTLYTDLEPVGALILANFHVRSRQIDFVVVTETIAAILEVKNLTAPAFGGQNGDWKIEDRSGRRVRYPGPNPWEQTLQQKFALSDEMRDYENKIRRESDPTTRFFTEFDAYVCVVPQIHPRSALTRGDKKVAVRSYADVIQILRSAAKPASWSRADWNRFAVERLFLTPVTVVEATDPKVRTAVDAVRAYSSRIESVLAFQLPPLLPAAPEREHGQALLDSILTDENHLIIGPSGSAKTFHLRHAAIAAAKKGDEVPIFVESKIYRGDFWSLVRRGTAPMFAGDTKALMDAVRICGLRPLLLVDALNECPTEHLGELLRGVQTFALHFDARVVFTSQAPVNLPEDLTSVVTELKTPLPDEKRFIYCHHAGLGISPDVDYFCESFTNAFELTVAGRCHASGTPATSRSELFDRYLQDSLPEHYHVGTALLRAIAVEMAATVSSSWDRAEYERFAERFVAEHGGSFAILDQLRRCRLIRLTDDFFSFEHELLADYFNAMEIHRKYSGSPELAAQLGKPRNQRLIELVLPWLSDDKEIGAVLSAARDLAVLSRVLNGRCGERAKAVLLGHIRSLFELAGQDVASINCTPHIVNLNDGRRRVGGVTVGGNRKWNPYCARLSDLIAHHLDDLEIATGLIELLDLTEWALRRAVEQTAAAHGIKPRGVWREVLRMYGGVLNWGAMQLPCTAILAELRTALMNGKYPDGLPIWQALLDRATGRPESHFALLALFQVRRKAPQDDLDTILDLVQRGWESGIYILKVEALEFVQFMIHVLRDFEIVRVRELLGGFETDNLLESTVLLETLSSYGAVDTPVTFEDALEEMRSTIAPDAHADPKVLEAARIVGCEPGVFLASRAGGCLSRIFEDIFQGAYWEAYCGLSREEKCAILSLASTCPDFRYHLDWLLHELLDHGGRDELPVYKRFAAGIDTECFTAQDATAAFLLAIEGCARFLDTPPPYTNGDTPAHRAWATIGEIFFWTHRKSDVARMLWSRFEGPLRLAVADVLYNVAHSGWQLVENGRLPVNLVAIFPNDLRPIVEDCLRERESLPTAFNYGGSRDRSVVLYLIDVLGSVGDDNSIRLLQTLVDDLELGPHAIRAIQSIRKPVSHIAAS
jgi:hypothetical protein